MLRGASSSDSSCFIIGLLALVFKSFQLLLYVELRGAAAGIGSTLVVGFALGGELGARAAVLGGEKLIRPVLVLAVVAMSGRMLGLY